MTDLTRRDLIAKTGVAISGAAAAALFGVPVLGATKSTETDLKVLNAALDLENQGIWAYSAAAPKLSKTEVGKTVLALAVRNRDDHVKHKDALIAAIKKLGGTPVPARESYDLSTYIKAGEGNLDSDANIAKLALALEVDAALAYSDAFSKLQDAGLISAAASIGANEAAHASAIRSVFHSLDQSIAIVPSAFVSADSRSQWILKV